jgi:cellulose synthase operon protein C
VHRASLRPPPVLALAGAALTALVLLAAAGLAAPGRAQTAYFDAERSARARDAVASAEPLIALGGFARAMVLFEHLEDPGAERRFLEEVAARAADPVTRAHAAVVLARRAARAGGLSRVRARYAALGFAPAVRAIGPFSNTGGASFGQPLPADDVAKTLTKKLAGLEREVGWQTIPLGPHAELDLGSRLTPTRETRALVAVVIHAPQPGPAALRLGSSGQVRALLNGAEVLRADVERSLGLDQSVALLSLAQGENLLVLEAGFLSDEAALRLRVTRPDGQPLPGLRFLVDAPAFARAARARPVPLPASAGEVTLADPVAASRAPTSSFSALRAGVAVEERLRSGDARARPPQLEAWLGELARQLEEQKQRPAEIASVLARLGDARRTRDPPGAKRAYEAALGRDADSLEALLGLSALREEQGDEIEARALLLRARNAAPRSDVAARALLSFERRIGVGGVDNDLATLARAKLHPTEANLELAADVLEARGDVAGALALVEKVRWPDAWRRNRLKTGIAEAKLASSATALEERLRLAREALELRPGSHSQAESYALALVAAGKREAAASFAVARAREYPERAEPLALQARLALVAGDRARASESLLAALALTPQDAALQRTLRSLGGNEEELVVRYGLDPAAYAAEPPPPEAKTLGAHVVASTTAIRFFDNGLGRVVTDRLIRIHDARKTAGLQTFQFPYSQGRELFEVLVAERITREGQREPALRIVDSAPSGKEGGVYTDVAGKIVVLGQLADGDLIHIRTRKELVGQQNLFGDFFGSLEPIQSVVPVRNFRLVVEAPLARPLAWGGRGAPEPAVREERDRRIYEFAVTDARAIEAELGMPPFLEAADFVSVSTYASWEALGKWYEALIAPQLVLDEDLKKIAREVARTSKSEEEKVRRLYEHVVTSTRYVGIELGIHGWKPYPVTEVHRRKYGDCKDKASLLVALLREAGVPANIALVRTANVGLIASEPPSMWTFNHAIAYVPSLDLFLDGTAEQSGWRELPAMDQGALTLIVGKHGDKKGSELRTIPLFGADSNLNESDYVLTLGRDGALAVRGVERFRGTHNAEQRRDFADPATRRERLEKHLAQIMPGTRVARVEVSDLSLAAEEISYRFEATLPERAVRDQNGGLTMALSLYPHDLAGNYAQQSARKTDIFLERPWRTRNVMRYVLPPGFTVADLPSGGSVKSKHLVFTQTITRTPDGFIVDEDTAIASRRIPAADYTSFREAALKADSFMKRKIRITAGRPPA